MPRSDSSGTYTRAVRPEPSPAVLRLTFAAGIPDVSRFRTEQELALASLFMLPSAHYKDVGVRIASFRRSITHPAYSRVYASPCTSRYLAQNSGPSGSLLLTRENFAFSASCRFIPAHCNRCSQQLRMNREIISRRSCSPIAGSVLGRLHSEATPSRGPRSNLMSGGPS